MVIEDRSEFRPGQRVRVREEGGNPATRPASSLLGKEGTIRYSVGTSLEGRPLTLWFVQFETHHDAPSISEDWL